MWPIMGMDWGARGGSRGSWLSILRAAIVTTVTMPINKRRRMEFPVEKAILGTMNLMPKCVGVSMTEPHRVLEAE